MSVCCQTNRAVLTVCRSLVKLFSGPSRSRIGTSRWKHWFCCIIGQRIPTDSRSAFPHLHKSFYILFNIQPNFIIFFKINIDDKRWSTFSLLIHKMLIVIVSYIQNGVGVRHVCIHIFIKNFIFMYRVFREKMWFVFRAILTKRRIKRSLSDWSRS